MNGLLGSEHPVWHFQTIQGHNQWYKEQARSLGLGDAMTPVREIVCFSYAAF